MVKTGEWIGEAWDKVVKGGNLGKFMLLALNLSVISIVIAGVMFFLEYPGVRSIADLRALPPTPFYKRLPFELLGIIVGGVIFFPMAAAVYAIILNFLRTGKVEFSHWSDISPLLGQIVLAGLVVNLFQTIGNYLCVIPGLIVMALYMFTLPVLLERRCSFWKAMEESRKKVQQSLLGFIWFNIVIGFVGVLGILVLGVGLLVSLPVGLVAEMVAYRGLWPEEPVAAEIAEQG